MSEDAGRISVSRDALRAELLTTELRLVEKLATKDEVSVLRLDVDSLKRWRAYLTGAYVLGTLILGVALTLLH